MKGGQADAVVQEVLLWMNLSFHIVLGDPAILDRVGVHPQSSCRSMAEALWEAIVYLLEEVSLELSAARS